VLGVVALVAAVSSVMSNTVSTAAFLPVVIGAADRARIPRSKVLLPMAFGSMISGIVFLIGTSSNLVVSAMMQSAGLAPLGFAELWPVGLAATVLGVPLIALLGRWLLPVRTAEEEDAIARRDYLGEVVVAARSPFSGKPLSELAERLGLRVLAVTRGGEALEATPGLAVRDGDALLLEEDRLDILRVKDLRGLDMSADGELPPGPGGEVAILAEASVPIGSSLVGRSLRDAFFAEHFGLVALAISRRPAIQRLTRVQLLHGLFGAHSISTLPLAVGDVLLLRGPRSRLRTLSDGRTLQLLGNVEYQPVRYRKAGLAVAIFAGAMVLGLLKIVPLVLAGLCGMLLMIATGCVDTRTAFRVDWRVVLMVGAMMALGAGMEATGAGRYLGGFLVPVADWLGARGVLVAVMVVTVILSAPMSNEAAALVVVPVAVGLARQLHLDPRPFAVGVCCAASLSYMTPLEPSCALVYGPGRYRFSDFVRMGTPLTLLLLVLFAVAIPLRWPF
jgi:di/tricarboxylate transporter